MNEKVKNALSRIPELLFLGLIIWGAFFYKDNDRHVSSPDGDGQEYLSDEEDGCKFEDGLHSASVDYYNPETGHTATYDLDVEISDCEVTEIHFPNEGWLDSSHFSPEELDEEGDVTIEDDRGRTFEVHLED